MSITYGELQYTGADSDIVGFYDGGTSEIYASRFDGGSAHDEATLLYTSFGLTGTVEKLDGPDSSTSLTIGANNYFTAKFGTSLALFHNTTDTEITVSWIKGDNDDCKSIGASPSQCGGISYFKYVPLNVVPVPASGVLLLAGLAGLGLARRRRS